MLQGEAAVDTPWWHLSNQQASQQKLDAQGDDSRKVAIVAGLERKLDIMHERSEATEAICREALAKAEEAQKGRAASLDELRLGLQAVTSRAGEIAAGLEVVAGCIGHMEDRLTKAKADTISEHVAINQKLKELNTRIDNVLSPQCHGKSDLVRQLHDLDAQMFRLQDTLNQRLPSGFCR
eukprot:CAMPEP_0172661958 /NCGR_PEP_ID=MMETSP1074-20121228/5054_1 /TAXON_ID=2916 /ORGANISM="Ceratium fusus, Strain PA161109" /LENGTH=179 /DNA_ID=CAMNT_0013477807 /DNA_START=13 /DNA_END=548 /DNA_ORIENTATION=+